MEDYRSPRESNGGYWRNIDPDGSYPGNPHSQSVRTSFHTEMTSISAHRSKPFTGINRPPRPPGPALGPYYQFIRTDLNRMLWLGSALIFRHVDFARPKVKFYSRVRVDYQWEILYEKIFDLRAYRLNLAIELNEGEGDDEIGWKIDWGDSVSEGAFYIARYHQKWRGGFFSCNGFDATVSEQRKSKLVFENVWNHLNSIHAQKPLHLLIWGGDQTYIDFIFEDVPYLQEWVDMAWNEKWTHPFHDDLRKQVEEYHFNTYVENWERPEVRDALASIPSIMMWDDHDIFDGAGSYPALLRDSPMMTGLFQTAQKMRLLFQHHTTVAKARDHGLFGYQAYNTLIHCGPNLAILGADGRSERDTETVHHSYSWDMIFEKLDRNIVHVSHLIVLFPVPFSFLRFKLAESVFERLKKITTSCRNAGLVKHNKSVFGLPELYDDLLDEWTHEAHLQERNDALHRFQLLAAKKKIRVTFFSGDVHCCGISRFRSEGKDAPDPTVDPRLMYQIISSAIVNIPPPRTALRVAHYVKNKWIPVPNTREELINFFNYEPGTRRRLFHKKILPNRNWCYFEQCEIMNSPVSVRERPISTISGAARNRSQDRRGMDNTAYEHSMDSRSIDHRAREERQPSSIHSLRIRLWLEGTSNRQEHEPFTSYDLLIPGIAERR